MTLESTRLRADAQENRDRILAAASELFAERGLDVGMRDIARRAGVGPATLYRRFPTRQDLIDEAFAVETAACRRIVEDGCADPDPWRGFSEALRRLIVLNVRNRGFVDALVSTTPSAATAAHRRELLGMLDGVARRAREQGTLRADYAPTDLILILSAGRGLSASRRDLLPAAARRFADLAIDGLRA
ncbi:helix-turn-helix domain-containing protein [Leifsonia sp. NPDC080035]|uniref:Helix-turn-helix domain-containing protein n=1 Tax=Leifsonia sp. NPDC080035 TaxID=3143936 RepID=A0AAU7G753_9MICO